MKVVLDRRTCNCWDAACETHFGWHFLRGEITPVDCTAEVLEDGKEAITFIVHDRDGSVKTLVVDESNRDMAYDSWLRAWEQQAKKG